MNENNKTDSMYLKLWNISYLDKNNKPAVAQVKAATQSEAVKVFHETVAPVWALSIGDADFKWPDPVK